MPNAVFLRNIKVNNFSSGRQSLQVVLTEIVFLNFLHFFCNCNLLLNACNATGGEIRRRASLPFSEQILITTCVWILSGDVKAPLLMSHSLIMGWVSFFFSRWIKSASVGHVVSICVNCLPCKSVCVVGLMIFLVVYKNYMEAFAF